MCSTQGGMDIETLAAEHPEALARVAVDPRVGIDAAKAVEIVDAAGFDEADRVKIAEVLVTLGAAFVAEDADWRGIGTLPLSGLALAPAAAPHDALRAFPAPPAPHDALRAFPAPPAPPRGPALPAGCR